MKVPILLSLLVGLFLAGCAGGASYRTRSVPEAMKLMELSVLYGITPASQRASEEARLCAGKPSQGKWDQAKMDRYISRWVSENPRAAQINLAATRKQITEAQRLELMSRLEAADAARRTEHAAGLAVAAGALNNAAASMNATAASYNATAAMYDSQPRTIYVKPVLPDYTPAPAYRPAYTPPPMFTPSYSGGYWSRSRY